MANVFAATLRRQLWKQHLGLIAPQFCPGPITPAMRPVGIKPDDQTDSWQDARVAVSLFLLSSSVVSDSRQQDPISDSTLGLWNATAEKNTEAFDNVFHVVPCKYVEGTLASYNSRVEKVIDDLGFRLETVRRLRPFVPRQTWSCLVERAQSTVHHRRTR